MDTLEFKTTESEVKKKKSLDGQWTEKRVHKLGGGSIEIVQHDEQREKRRKKEEEEKKKRSQGPWNAIKTLHIHVIGALERDQLVN